MKNLLALIGIFGLSTSLTLGSVVSCDYSPKPKPNPKSDPTPNLEPKPLEIHVSTKRSNITDATFGDMFQSTNSDGTLWSGDNTLAYNTEMQMLELEKVIHHQD